VVKVTRFKVTGQRNQIPSWSAAIYKTYYLKYLIFLFFIFLSIYFL